MLNFENIEDLVSYMFENTDNEDCTISLIAPKEMIIDTMHELLNYENVVLNSCDIDYNENYDREYIITLFDDPESDKWYIAIEKSYLEDNNKYLSAGGYVLFHEDVNSKAQIDMQNNEYMPLGDYDWFTISEKEFDDTDENVSNKGTDLDGTAPEDDSKDSGYSVTVKVDLGTDEAEDIIRDMKRNLSREVAGMFNMLYKPYLYEYYSHPIRFFW